MLDELLDVLRCPVCAQALVRADSSLRCAARHTFDIARQGYVNLLPGGATASTADTAAMVRARAAFLAAGHYAPLVEAVTDVAASVATSVAPDGEVALDVGAGTGYYLGAVVERLPSSRGLALDVSKAAARQAARVHSRVSAAVWDTWQPLPVHDESVDLVLNVFAPRNGAEFRRVLRPGGSVLVVTPTRRHLAELVVATGMLTVDAAKQERVERSLSGLRLEHRDELAFGLRVSPEDVQRLVAMGPSAWHVDGGSLRRHLAGLAAPFETTSSVTISQFRR